MNNSFLDEIKQEENLKHTENGGVAYKSTCDKVYDLFAFGGAYRKRNKEDKILLFKEAYEQDKNLALKSLFYLRDILQGQGEREYFRICFHWLSTFYPEDAKKVLILIPNFGRWDDLLYATNQTPVEKDALEIVKKQLLLDLDSKTPSLLGKWLPSENAAAKRTKNMGNKIRTYLDWTHKQYRQTLSLLRTRINIVEKLMSENRWEEIEFDKIPSKAGLLYKNAFARRDLIKEKYQKFVMNDATSVNAKALYPYELVHKAIECGDKLADRMILEKYWKNLPDFLKGKDCKILTVIDTSGSMTWSGTTVHPIDVAISLGLYCSERIGEPFKDYFISFSSQPQFIKVQGIDFVDKVQRIYERSECSNTNLAATFALLKEMALRPGVKKEDCPNTLVIISDMEIDEATSIGYVKTDRVISEIEKIRQDWVIAGLDFPKIVYWNVDARSNTILDRGPNISFVSGCSPVLFEQVMTGVSGYELMLNKLLSERYKDIQI